MNILLLVGFLTICSLSICFGSDLISGTSYNGRLTWQEKVEYMAFPFKKRVKEVFYNDPGQQTIKGIIAREMEHTGATATITAGGVGFTFANIRFKSERSGGLKYNLEFYV